MHVYLPCTKIARAKLSPRCGEYGKRGGGRKVQRERRGEESRERRADKEKMIEKSKKGD